MEIHRRQNRHDDNGNWNTKGQVSTTGQHNRWSLTHGVRQVLVSRVTVQVNFSIKGRGFEHAFTVGGESKYRGHNCVALRLALYR